MADLVEVVGYFTDAEQAEPAFDPGHTTTPCLVCMLPLDSEHLPLKTISLAWMEGAYVSVFFRVHKECWECLTGDEQEKYEGVVLTAFDPREERIDA